MTTPRGDDPQSAPV